VLGDDDLALGDEAAGDGAGGFHEGLPVATVGLLLVAGRSRRATGDEFRGFGGADGFASVTIRCALGEEGEDGVFQFGVRNGGFLVAAGVAAVFDDVPVLGPFFLEGEGAAAGLADFFFAWGGAVGFGFAVGHWLAEMVMKWRRLPVYRLSPSGMGEIRVSGFSLLRKWPTLIDDETVAKMGHPVVVVQEQMQVLRLRSSQVRELPFDCAQGQDDTLFEWI